MQTDIIRELISKRNLAVFAVTLVSTLVGSIISTANCFAAIGVSVSSNPAMTPMVQGGKLTAVQQLLSVTADGVDAPGGYHVTMTTQSNSLNRVGGNGAIKSTTNQLSSPNRLAMLSPERAALIPSTSLRPTLGLSGLEFLQVLAM